MANRNFNRKQSLEREVKDIYFSVSFGDTGAPTLLSSVGVASISRTSQGLYLVTLEDKYFGGLKHFSGTLLDADAEDIVIQLKEEAVAVSKTLSFFTNTSATATDPSNGSKAFFKLELKNSTIL